MLITNFASGELSKKLYGRADLTQYYQGASRLKNFSIIPTGGIERRCGFRRCGPMAGEARLIPFVVNKSLSYVLEIGAGYIDIWKNGEKIEPEGAAEHYFYNEQIAGEVTVNWLPASLEQARTLQFAQNYDSIYFVHRELPPFYLKWDASGFILSKMTFDFEPDIEVIDDYGKYDASEDPDIPQPFDPVTFQQPGHYPGVIAFYQNRLWLASTAREPQKVWVSSAPNAKGMRYNVFETYTHYVTVSRVLKDADIHVFTASAIKGSKVLTGVTQDFTGIEDITKYYVSGSGIPVGAKIVSATTNTITMDKAVTDDMSSEACSIQLWVDPGTPSADDYEYDIRKNDMTTADSGFYFELASDQNDNIKWMSPSQHLVIGTESSEYVVPSGVNALSIGVSLNGRHSSDDIQALFVDEAVIFFAQGKMAIREYYWNAQTAAFQSNNITIMNPEILEESEAVDFDYMNNPYGRLLITRNDGVIAVLLYEKSAGVLGWSRYEHGKGKVISCASVRSDNASDTVYAAVKYEDGTVYIEELNLTGKAYLDSFSPFNAETESQYTDDAVIYDGEKEIILGATTNNTDLYGDNVIIGYKYESLITSMPVIGNNVTGTKRISDLLIRFSESCLPEIVNPNGVTEHITGIAEPYSGIRKVIYPGSSDRDVFFTIKTDKPSKCVVLAVNANLA